MLTNLLESLRQNGVEDLLGADLSRRLEALGVHDLERTQAGDIHVLRGTVLPLSDLGLPDLGRLSFGAPGLNSGLQFQLAVERPGGGPASRWAIDLDLDRISLVLPDLRPARERRLPAAATTLEPLASRAEVRVVGRAVLRVAAVDGNTPSVELVDVLDRVNPFGQRGPVVGLTLDPPSFFLGTSSFGMTVDEITYDQSASTSPLPKPAGWKGLAIRRATLFMPPGAHLVGDMSLGVFDLFLGDPAGIQGTAVLEMGGPGDIPATLMIEQQLGGSWQTLAVAPVSEPGTRDDRFTVALEGTIPPAPTLRARLATAPPEATAVRWVVPGGGHDPTAGFYAGPGDSLQVFVGDGAPTTAVFTGTWAPAATITLTLGPASWDNVTSLTGTTDALRSARFAASGSSVAGSAWRWDGGAEDAASTVSLPPGVAIGMHVLELRRSGRTLRRLRIELRQRGPVLVGCQAGTFAAGPGPSGTAVPIIDVAGTFGLTTWHGRGDLHRAAPPATPSSGTADVGQGLLAEVVTASEVAADGTTGASTPTATQPASDAHIRFTFDSDELSPADQLWIGHQTAPLDQLGAWAASMGDGARFVVVGRCDDLSQSVPLSATTDPYNRDLGARRAQRAHDLLVAAGVDPTRIASRAEQSGYTGSPPPAGAALPAEATTSEWLARATSEYLTWARPHPRDDQRRRPLRRANIYAYDVAPTPAATPAAQDGVTLASGRLRALVPGADPTVVTGATVVPSPRPQPPFRVRVEVEWQDPTARSLGEAVPSRAGVQVQWPGQHVRLPGGATVPVTRPGAPAGPTPPEWSLRGHWSHDRTAGSDQFTLSLDVAGSPAGIAQVEDRILAGALGLAPAVVGAAANPSGGDAALVGALIAAIGGACTALLRDGSKTVVSGVTIDHLRRGDSTGSQTRLTVDYTVELSVDVGQSGLPLTVSTRPDRPMKLRYRGVGVEIDSAAPDWWDGVGLVVTGAQPEIVDPGSWRLGPPLDDLLRVADMRAGAQSQWLELDLALAADLGVVKLSSATVRIVFGAGGVSGLELRGLRAAVDIPGAVRGEGALDVSNGRVHAGISLEVVPVKVMAIADLVFDRGGMVALTVGVRFPAPIPFANSGLGLFGLVGRFVSEGKRAIGPPNGDPVRRELGWLEKPPSAKYDPASRCHALGLGAVIGTVADAGFTLHALGMLTIESPRPGVIFGVIAEMLSGTAPIPVDQAAQPGAGLAVIGLVVINQDAVTIAVRGRYEIPGILKLDVPVGAWFPYQNPERSWVHVGTDNQQGRLGSPVTMTLLPDVLDVRVWAFVMIHGDGLFPGLMGRPEMVFSGFAIGFGAGFEIEWSAGPIRLEASAMVLAGFGTSPLFLAAGIFVRGELDLVILRISAQGELTLKTDGRRTDLHGRFCGEVDCFFFSISGCVEINISASFGAPGAPPSPVSGVDLVSRLGHATAKAVRPGTGEVPLVWPDTVPLVHFAHVMAPAVTGGSFRVGTPMPGPVWSGSRDLKYAYRLTQVRLEPTAGPPLDPPPGTKFDTAWWWPGVRSSSAPSPLLSATGIETRDLALLTWVPWTGLLPLSEPDGSPGDPGPIIGAVCEPVSQPKRVCLPGERGREVGAGAAVVPGNPGGLPASLRLAQPVDGDSAGLVAAATSAGATVWRAHVARLDQPYGAKGWRLANLTRGGQVLGSIGCAGIYDPPLDSPDLLLEICPVRILEKGIRPIDVPEGCADISELDQDALRRLLDEEGHLRFGGLELHAEDGSGLELVDLDGDGHIELLVPSEGLRIRWPDPRGSVTVQTVHGAGITVVAFDDAGETLAVGHIDSSTDSSTVEADGITSVVLSPEGESGLARVCAGADPMEPIRDLLEWKLEPTDDEVPEVMGVLPDGRLVSWKPTVKRGPRCIVVRYEAPEEGPWNGLRIAALPGRQATIIESCGVHWQAAIQARQAEQHRVEVLAAWNQHALDPGANLASAPGLSPLPIGRTEVQAPPRPLLQAGTEYRLSVAWEWQSWSRTGSQTQPPAPNPHDWTPGGDDTFVFRTAEATGTATPQPPLELLAESGFDPRSVARYVTGAHPSGPLPHLLDDPVRVTFSVDYLPALLERYGFAAHVEVRPTDIAPGGAPPGTHPPDVVTELWLQAWTAGSITLPTERRILDAASQTRCLGGGSLGGSTVQVLAALQPDTAYDLVLAARPATPGDDRVVQRWHFRTSRYRDIHEVIAALGLTRPEPTAVAPADVLLTGPFPPLAPAPHDDTALDVALAEMELDPWPLSEDPRTTTIWVPPGGAVGLSTWGLAGVLLEAPEPIARHDRIDVEASIGTVRLAHLRGTTSGTRVLLAPPAPISVAPTDALAVRLYDRMRMLSAHGAALLLGGPRTIRREVS